MTPEEHQRRIQEIAQRVAERLADQRAEAGAHINDLEDFAERVGHEAQREVSAEVLQEEAARKEGNQSTCPCAGRALFQRFHGLGIDDRGGPAPGEAGLTPETPLCIWLAGVSWVRPDGSAPAGSARSCSRTPESARAR